MKITLLRHGEIEKKYIGCYNGHIDISLSNDGFSKAKKLNIPKDFDGIFCSDLKRAKQTLEALHIQKQPIYTDKLREKSWGDYEGKRFDEIDIEYKNFTQWIEALGGESYEEFSKRVENFFFKKLPLYGYKNVLVVTHSGVIKTLLAKINNLTLEEAFSLDIPYLSTTVISL